jgi:transcriptional regulator with XRE-family HTH domain
MIELKRTYEKLIGRRLHEGRTRRGWALKYVAAELGVSATTVSDWERGKRFPSGLHLLKLSVLFKAPVCALFCVGQEKCPGPHCGLGG